MGDMADFFLAHELEARDRDDEGNPYPPASWYKTCKHCGLGGLQWRQTDGKWRLYEDSTMHSCRQGIAAARAAKEVADD